MSRLTRICLALLAGVALIWLVQIAAVAVTSIPGLSTLLRWLRTSGLPLEVFSPGVVAWLPVFGASLLVGLVGFRLPERRGVVFLCLAAPFVAFSLYANVGMLVSAGNSLSVALAQPDAWLVITMALLGLGGALLLVPRASAA